MFQSTSDANVLMDRHFTLFSLLSVNKRSDGGEAKMFESTPAVCSARHGKGDRYGHSVETSGLRSM